MIDLQPSAPERARTVLTHATTMTIELGGDIVETVDITGVDTDGSLTMLVGSTHPLVFRVAEHPAPCRLHAALVSPLPGADRILDRVTAVGQLCLESEPPGPDGAVSLRMTLTALNLDGIPVSPNAYAAAEADPLAAGSAAFVEHLGRGHAAEVVLLAHLLDPAVVEGVRTVTPVRVDRLGLTLRLHQRSGSSCVRLNFEAAVRDPRDLPRAMQALQLRAARVQTCPFSDRPRP